jgi:hypothetical protein
VLTWLPGSGRQQRSKPKPIDPFDVHMAHAA